MPLLVGENGKPLTYCTLRFRLEQARNADTPDYENQSIIPRRVFLCGLAVFRILAIFKVYLERPRSYASLKKGSLGVFGLLLK